MRQTPSWLSPARLAAACVALLASSTVAAGVVGHTGEPTEVVAGGAGAVPHVDVVTPASTATDPTTTTTVEPAPPPSTTPPTTASPAPVEPTTTTVRPMTSTTRKTPTPTAPSATLGPRPPGSAVFPYKAGQTSWHGTAGGITLDVKMEPPLPRAGEEVRFTVTSTFAERECCLNSLLFGDGRSARDPDSRCAGGSPGSATSTFTHIYNKPGRWEFSFQGMAGRCGDHNLYGALYGFLEVARGSSRGQGPSLPTLEALEARAPSDPVVPGFLKVWAKARDEDGFVHHFVIDYGDGSATETRPGDPFGCRPTPSGWPAPSQASIEAPYPSHQYATPGSYTITVTVVSTACDGSEAQRASATIPYVW